MFVTRRWKAAIVTAATLAFLCKILLALNTWGTNDVFTWERFADWSRIFGAGLYVADRGFNHPPAMIHALHAMQWAARVTGIFFPFWLRLPAIVADTASLWIVWQLLSSRFSEPRVRWGLLLLAASPVLLLVSGFHGNTDPVMIFFLLLSVWLTDRSSDLAAGAAFGLAMCVKVVPLIALPVLFFYRSGQRRRVLFSAAAIAVILVCWSPYLYQNPMAIFHQVFGYKSDYGHWGFSYFFMHFRHFPHRAHVAYQRLGGAAIISSIALAAFFVNRFESRPALYRQVGAAFFLFLAVSNGFGVQYLAWLVPWTVGLDLLSVAFFQLASGVFLFLTYNYWSGGFPWYLADAFYAGDFGEHLAYFHVLAWLSVIALAWSSCRQIGWSRQSSPNPRLRWQLAFSLLAIPLLFYPMQKQLREDARAYPPVADRKALASIHARENTYLSERLRTGLAGANDEILFPRKPDDLRRMRFLSHY